MTTLADSFLADLDDLSDDDARDGDDDARARANANANDATARAGTTAAARAEDLDDVATLTTTERYLRVTRAVDEAMERDGMDGATTTASGKRAGAIDEGAEALVVACNALTVEVDNEVAVVHQYIKGLW